jgi:hypothetical protein
MYYYYYYKSPVKIKFTFKEYGEYFIGDEAKVTIETLSSFLYDLNLLYDCLALALIDQYSDYNFSQFFYYRKGRPLKKEHKLYLNRINHNSPLGLEVIIPLAASSAGIPWLILQSAQKIRNWKLERRKLEIEVQKAELDLNEKKAKLVNEQLGIEEKLLRREAFQAYNNVLKRIENHPFFAVDVEIEMIEPDNYDDNEKKE